MVHPLFIFLGIIGVSGMAIAEPTLSDMEARNKKSMELDSSYEMKAVKAFWGDASFMQICAPKDAPLPEHFTIYFEVLPTGDLGETLLAPVTKAGECMLRNAKDRAFPKPVDNYVVKMGMTFQK